VKLLAVAALGAVTVIAAPTVASAAGGSTTCTEGLAPGSYHHVVVPADAVCIIEQGPVTIHAGLEVREGATFVLGSDENPVDMGTISGGVRARNAMNLQIHHTHINGGIRAQGGAGPFGGPFDVTWIAIEDNVIKGGASIAGFNGFWMGFLGNDVRGTVNLRDNVLVDTDGNEYVSNVIHGTLKCAGNDPAPQVGDSEGVPNRVTGVKQGQCQNV
jgi:hypothetical protein